MKRVTLVLIFLSLFLYGSSSNAAANLSEAVKSRSKDRFLLIGQYGATEIGESLLVNYVFTEITVPELRVYAFVCATLSIFSKGELQYRQQKQCKDFGPGISVATSSWYVYQPSDPNERIQIQGGQSEIKIEYELGYQSVSDALTCNGEDPMSSKYGQCDPLSISMFPPRAVPPTTQIDNARLVSDIAISNGTVVVPGQALVKTWEIVNSGNTTWNSRYRLVFREGNKLGAPEIITVPALAPHQRANLSVPLQIPANISLGEYSAGWQLRNDQGTHFGDMFRLKVTVPAVQVPTGNNPNGELLSIISPTSTNPNQRFWPEITLRLSTGQLRQDRGDMLRHYGGTNYSDFPHIAVQGTVDSGQPYTFRFYNDHPMVAPNERGTYESTWRVWSNGGWIGPEIPIRFSVYQANDSRPPTAPTLTSPNNWAVLVGQSPTLCAQQNGDPDGDAVNEYRFVIYESAKGYDSGWVTNNCVTPSGLENYTYKWHAKVRDSRGTESNWSEDRHFTIESSTVTITKLEFNPPSPSNSEFVFISVDSTGCGGVGVGGDVYVNTAADGSANGEWRKIKDIPGPRTTPQDEPRWETIEYAEGLHRVRVEMKSCDDTISIRDAIYQVTRGKPSRPFLQAPANAFWSDTRTITFRWLPALRAQSYTLKVGLENNSDTASLVNVTLSGTEYTTTFAQDYTKIYWWVFANNELGSTRESGRWVGIDRTPPVSSISTERTPPVSFENQVNISWDGTDNASGVHTYDVQVRAVPEGQWTDWLTNYTFESAIFTGQLGHTYCFRGRARDIPGNVEAYPTGETGDHCLTIDPNQRPPQAWWDPAYAHKRTLVIVNHMAGVSVPARYPVHLHFDESTTPAAAEIYNGSMAAVKGDDVRVIYNDQIDVARHIVNFTPSVVDIWFATQAEIGGNGSVSNYALYYGNAAPNTPPATLTDIYAPPNGGQTAALWYFEEQDSSTPDMSGNGRSITWVNGVSRGLDYGVHGRGVRLDGNQWGTVAPITGDHLTVEGWVRFDDLLSHISDPYDWTGMIAAYDSRDNHNRWRISLTGHNNGTSSVRGDIEIRDTNGTYHERSVERSEIRIEANKLYHFALTYDGNTIRLWSNGDVVATSNIAGTLDSRMTTVYVGRNRPDHPPMLGRLDGLHISTEAKASFPYARITVKPSVAAGQELGQDIRGQADLALHSLETTPDLNGNLIVQAVLENQGQFSTYNEVFVHLYKDHTPVTPGDLDGSVGFWVNAPIAPGEVVTLATVLTEVTPIGVTSVQSASLDETFSLSAQADSMGVVNEADKTNNMISDVQVCIASADAHEEDDSPSTAPTRIVGEVVHHNFHKPEEQDWLRFQAEAGKTYVLQTQNLGVAADTVLSLYAPDGITLLASNDDADNSLASRIEWTAPATEWYYVQVRHWNPYVGGCGTSYEMLITEAVDELPIPTVTATPTPTPVETPTPDDMPTPEGWPGKPILMSPPNGVRLIEGTDVVLQWTEGIRASRYASEYWLEDAGHDRHNSGELPLLSRAIGPQPVGRYWWYVEAYNDLGWSGWTEEWTFTVVPYAPMNLQVANVTCQQVALVWENRAEAVTEYWLTRVGANLVQTYIVDDGGGTRYVDFGVNENQTYSYWVQAVVRGIDSDKSNAIDVTVPSCTPGVETPVPTFTPTLIRTPTEIPTPAPTPTATPTPTRPSMEGNDRAKVFLPVVQR